LAFSQKRERCKFVHETTCGPQRRPAGLPRKGVPKKRLEKTVAASTATFATWYMHGTKSNQTPLQAAHNAAAPLLSPALIAAINKNHHMSLRATAVIDNRSVPIPTSHK
jgi:hypothetical protein